MGVFNKLKNIFYDVVVEEDEQNQELDKTSKIVKKEPSIRDEAPKVEELKFKTIEMDPIEEETKKVEIKEEPQSDRDLFRSQRTFNFVDFTDEEEEEKTRQKRNVLDESNRVMRSTEPAREEPPRVFKPTPVISPIWGVLDKDYKKEEIKEKTLTTETFTSSVTDYDNVRRKAYGTLEDDLEDTLNSLNTVTTDEIKEKISKKKDTVEVLDSRTAKIEDIIDKIDEATDELDKNMSLEEAENKVKIKNFDDVDDDEKDLNDSTLEHDLFNLIDSMYDKED